MKVWTSHYTVPIKYWLDIIEDKVLTQANNVAQLPFAFKHLAIMPDAHLGFGTPIGTVFASEEAVVPNIVGKDEGCGVMGVKTSISNASNIPIETLKDLVKKIRATIPMGHGKWHKDYQMNDFILPGEWGPVVEREAENIDLQIGTLGSGNHFIELQKGFDDHLWVVIHSGSRNLGAKVADYYNRKAIKLNKKWHSSVRKEDELAFLPLDSCMGAAYLTEMKICVDFASANRRLMMNRVKNILSAVFGEVEYQEPIDTVHNYARMENHFGRNVMVHRKGAVSAREGEICIIPGTPGGRTYIVKGKGNKESFTSCSHGAGRAMSRTAAKVVLDLEEEREKLDKNDVIHSITTEKDLGEAQGAYKNIQKVMQDQKDLVSIVEINFPLAIIKG